MPSRTHRRLRSRFRQQLLWACVALGAIAALTLAARANAQSVGVAGRVVDASSGVGVEHAEVTVLGVDTLRARTNATGEWRVSVAHAGRYEIRVRRVGYLTVTTVETLGTSTRRLLLPLHAAPLALDNVVVTAARRPQKLADVVITTEVITRSEIEQTGASDLASVLVEHTGIQMQGGHPSGTGVMLQGIGSERVLVLLDGQPVAGRLSGVFDVSRIPTSIVERVEVVKGPQSTLYGTDAMGGVINIITRNPGKDVMRAAFNATGGTQDRRELTANVSAGVGALGAEATVGHRTIETTPGQASADGALAARTDGLLKVQWRPDSVRRVEANVLALDERQRWRSGSFYNFGDNRQVNGRLGGTFARGAHRLSPSLSASLHDHRSRASTATLPIAGDTGQRQQQRVYQAELLYNGRIAAHAIDAGVQVRRDETETERVVGGRRELMLFEPFAQADVAVTRRLSLLPGVRLSSSKMWGSRLTPRVAARWRATDQLSVRASAGEGFRVPDFKELFMFFQNTSAGYAVLGNEQLRPESSKNVSLGSEWTVRRGFVRGTLFLNQFRNFIETRAINRAGEPPIYQYANVDNGATRGADVEAGLVAAGWRVDAGYNLLATRDNATGRPLLARPSHSGRLSMAHTLPFAFRASVSGIATGRTPMERDEATGVISSSRDAFVRVDARIARSLPYGAEFVLGSDNVFNAQPAQWAAFTGRHTYTALSFSFTHTR